MYGNVELSDREKVMIYGGLVLVFALFAVAFVFIQFFIVEDRFHLSDLMKSGVSGFSIARTFSLALYTVIIIPAAFIGPAVYSYFGKKPFTWRNVLIMLLLPGLGIALDLALLTLLDLLVPNLTLLVQMPLVALVVTFSLVVTALTSRTRRIHDYLKKHFD